MCKYERDDSDVRIKSVIGVVGLWPPCGAYRAWNWALFQGSTWSSRLLQFKIAANYRGACSLLPLCPSFLVLLRFPSPPFLSAILCLCPSSVLPLYFFFSFTFFSSFLSLLNPFLYTLLWDSFQFRFTFFRF